MTNKLQKIIKISSNIKSRHVDQELYSSSSPTILYVYNNRIGNKIKKIHLSHQKKK